VKHLPSWGEVMTIIEQAQKIRQDMNAVAATLTDEQGLDLIALFEPWHTNTPYTVNDRRRHDNTLYRCVQAHTSLSDWTPDATPALWTRISVEEYPQWVQPTGAHDAYMIGDKVTFDDQRYVSVINNNTWSPSAYPQGWQLAG
jgi:hypothetical protein